MGNKKKMTFNGTWSMAVGGMIGGGIFSVLGIVIRISGQLAWLSFILAGIIALISAHSYSQLSIKYEESGGAFAFLNEIDHEGMAGSLSWILIMGYILTMSVYAFTFGHYIAYQFSFGNLVTRIIAISIIVILAAINLRGVSDSTQLEIITVWGKLIVLLGIAIYGLVYFDVQNLTAGIEVKGWDNAIVGAATIFMAYEGFQLLFYDYDDIKKPEKTLPQASILAVLTVIVVYILVVIGISMLVGAETLIKNEAVVMSIAGRKAFGEWGLILVTIAAAFSTASAINATLFSTARLMETVARKKDMPHIFVKENQENIPYYAVIAIASVAALLATFGSLITLVDAASLIFLVTFGIVNYIAFMQNIKYKFLSLIGGITCFIAILITSYKQLQSNPIPLFIVFILIVLVFVGRPYLLKLIND